MRPCPAKSSVRVACVACVAWVVRIAGVLAVLGAAGREARAQAWVGDKGALDVSLDYNLGKSSKVLQDKPTDVNGDGTPDDAFEDSGTTSHQFSLGAEYVPVRRLAVSVAIPLMLLKYTGSQMLNHGVYDDGKTHTTLTDLRTTVRYQVLEEPFALSPHLGVSIPLADYETVGNTVAGRHLKALHMGIGIGRVFGISTYAHLLYEFSLVEKYDRTADTKKHGQNRSDIAITIGHTVLDQRLDLHVDANARLTHGGVNFSEFGMLTPDEQMYHDAILKEDIFLVGGGIGYRINNSLGLSLAGRIFVTGSNTQNASVLALGVTWTPL